MSGERSDTRGESSERGGERSDELEQHGWLRLPSVGKFLAEPLADLVAAAAFLRHVLPEIASDLSAIRTHVGSMDPEMVGMHASVERIEGQMGDLNDRIGDLAARMADVERAVARLEPHVADVNLAMRPLRRAWARVRPVQDHTAEVQDHTAEVQDHTAEVQERRGEDDPARRDGSRDPRL